MSKKPHHPVWPDDIYREQEKQNKIPLDPPKKKEEEIEDPNWSRDRFKDDPRYDLAS